MSAFRTRFICSSAWRFSLLRVGGHAIAGHKRPRRLASRRVSETFAVKSTQMFVAMPVMIRVSACRYSNRMSSDRREEPQCLVLSRKSCRHRGRAIAR